MESQYCKGGREILIGFTCGRCGKRHIEPYAEQVKTAEGNIQGFAVPDGWLDESENTPMLCDECYKAFKLFLNNA